MGNLEINLDSSFYSNRQLEVEKIKTFLNRDSNHGLTGLKNLGNSCYLNTILQCLSNTVELTYYFISGVYNNDINTNQGNGVIKRGLSK